MKKITPVSQEGFDLTVDFTLNDGTVRREVIAMKPFYFDVTEMVPSVDKNGVEVKDKKGKVLMEKQTKQAWTNPADNLKTFLNEYGAALERGIEIENAPQLAPEFFGKSL